MAKKVLNLVVGVIVGIFMVMGIGLFMNEADNALINTESIGSDFYSIGENASGDYYDDEILLSDSTYGTGIFSLPEDQQVDTRGISQGGLITKNNPATIKTMIVSIGGKLKVHPLIIGLVISLVIITSIWLFYRLIRGEGSA